MLTFFYQNFVCSNPIYLVVNPIDFKPGLLLWKTSNMSYNPDQNILAIQCLSVQVWFTTSKIELDILIRKSYIRVASRDAEQLKK